MNAVVGNPIRCPWCGHDQYDVDPETKARAIETVNVMSKHDGRRLFCCKCNWCGANGPFCDDADMARKEFSKFSNAAGQTPAAQETPHE